MRAADPVALHRQDSLGPGLEQLHLVEQTIRVVGDPEEPLLEVLLLDDGTAALATALDDLLVGEHSLVDRAPVDRGLLAVGKVLLVELQKEPLRPAVVLRRVTRDLATPVDRPPHSAHLLANRGDVALRDRLRMPAFPDSRVLGGQAERVVAHRTQHALAVPPAEMHEHVAQRVVLHVAHVQLTRRIGQHLEHVGARRVAGQVGRARVGDIKRALARPDFLPACLYLVGVVAPHRSSSFDVAMLATASL